MFNSETTNFSLSTTSTMKQIHYKLLETSKKPTSNTSSGQDRDNYNLEGADKQLQRSERCDNSRGHLSQFPKTWKRMTPRPRPTSVLQHGHKLQFTKTPIPWKSRPMNISTTEQIAINEAVSKSLEAEIIEKSQTQDKSFLSNFFTIKEATKRRPILNCQQLNQLLQCEHFKMEGGTGIERNTGEGRLYAQDRPERCVCGCTNPLTFKKIFNLSKRRDRLPVPLLSFKLNNAPRIFSKIMKYAIEPLRKKGI
ncbi:hypothetical protein G6F56_012009 [Rhizopus delemar]|nr:hypothetical protein G6F56_012009 [Rhizopus delemar]